MDSARFAVVSAPIDRAAVEGAVASEAPGREGAVVTFVGAVRGENGGRRVRHLDYEAYAPLAERVFERIAEEAASEWPGARLAVHHRVGRLLPGEASVVIASASPHRAEAFAACRYAIERIKQVAPIWKREAFDQGGAWVEGAAADPDDEAARRAARERACG